MTITITQEEYDAISFATTQIETEIEGASNEVFINDACNSQRALYRIMEKYKTERYKAREFQSVRAVVAENYRGRCLLARDIDKIARKLLKQMKQDGRL